MLLKYIERDCGNHEFIYLIPISDLHIGDIYFNEKKFLHLRDYIVQNSNVFVILLGDIFNSATKNSVSDIYSEIKNPQEAKKYAYNMFKPMKDKILGIVSGNHEQRIWRESGSDISEDLALLLGCEYNREGLFLNIKVGNYKNNGKVNYTVYCTHGSGGGTTVGAKANVMEKTSKIVLADIYIIGHIHGKHSFDDEYIVPDVRHKRLEKIRRLYVGGASFLEWGGYSEQKLMKPYSTGSPKIVLDGTKKEFHVII